MKKSKILTTTVIALLGLTLFFIGAAAEEEAEDLTFEQPLLITSIGQSPGAMMAKVLAKRVDLKFVYNPTAKGDNLEDLDVNTIVAVVGASGKGLGAAGLDIEDEISRVKGLLQAAKDLKIPMIIMHIEGVQRRGDMSNKLIKTFVPQSDYIIVQKSGNDDGLFTELSEENEITMEQVEKAEGAAPVLDEIIG
ncbi:hypothetical protein KGY71_03555 [Candidatus Bipolaricaulota bacterium]|nr:hypothetical protein [Candidatus Bipolaricaulota bacterium]